MTLREISVQRSYVGRMGAIHGLSVYCSSNSYGGMRNIRGLYIATALCLFGYSAVVVSKIEGYSWHCDKFYESLKVKMCMCGANWFKSYAQLLFYFQNSLRNLR